MPLPLAPALPALLAELNALLAASGAMYAAQEFYKRFQNGEISPVDYEYIISKIPASDLSTSDNDIAPKKGFISYGNESLSVNDWQYEAFNNLLEPRMQGSLFGALKDFNSGRATPAQVDMLKDYGLVRSVSGSTSGSGYDSSSSESDSNSYTQQMISELASTISKLQEKFTVEIDILKSEIIQLENSSLNSKDFYDEINSINSNIADLTASIHEANLSEGGLIGAITRSNLELNNILVL
ncbi:hypothetical protein CIG11343_0591 [Campylobacter iguaniorum]|uniref:hypothetical protein n=1 Tax=Campylobacter iguaniorum TaxID=1244531 RepID=UPI0007C87EE0|nr:hypothetical protein [Campylobacter iguaniorum]ANE35652.1 hypothetical protein CIG11343_0591 [Campylobacter iguaniorum]